MTAQPPAPRPDRAAPHAHAAAGQATSAPTPPPPGPHERSAGSQSGDEPAAPPSRTWRKREAFLLAAALAAVFIFLVLETRLPPFTTHRTLSQNVVFFLLINLNIVLIVLVVALLGRNIVKLAMERRERVLGSHLRTRLVLAFVVVALVPAVLLFATASGFIRSSIESWFSIQVESALEGSLDVADTYYRDTMAAARREAREVAGLVAKSRGGARAGARERAALEKLIEEKRREYDVVAVRVLDSSGDVIAQAMAPRTVADLRSAPSRGFVARALVRDEHARLVQRGDSEMLRAAARLPANGAKSSGAVVVDRAIPESVARRHREIGESYREYKQLKLLRRPLINNYVLTLLLASLVVVFGGTWLGFTIARSITGPIQRLAEGTRRVAAGHLDERIDLETGSDEIATLVDAFNQMTGNLATTHSALAERRAALETILANITGGVVSIDRQARIETVNAAARHMLGIDADAVGMPFRQWFSHPRFAAIRELLSELDKRAQQGIWDKLPPQRLSIGQGEEASEVLATGVVLKDEVGDAVGALLFFEDVTELLKVQRMEAWREVARRIAHEIKNPLTPIQLSAQRLRKRYAGQLGGSILDECTRTIIAEVEVLRNLVSEFSHFARLPSSPHVPSDLNQLVDDALVLFREAHRGVHFTFVRGEIPSLDLDRDGIKRVLTNLLDNAVAALGGDGVGDAGSGAGDGGTADALKARGNIEVATRYDAAREVVRLEVADDGAGIAPEVKARLFEPYFSTKPQGTGLGLAIVAGVLAEHRAYIRVRDNEPRGSRFVVEFSVRESAPGQTTQARTVLSAPAARV